jgi:hypothetical protein
MTSFMPKDPDDQRRVKETLNRQRVMQTLGGTKKLIATMSGTLMADRS